MARKTVAQQSTEAPGAAHTTSDALCCVDAINENLMRARAIAELMARDEGDNVASLGTMLVAEAVIRDMLNDAQERAGQLYEMAKATASEVAA